MTPYYQDDYVTIYHGDCREIVPTLGRFDLLLTDPPYGVTGQQNTLPAKRRAGRKNAYAGMVDTLDYVRDVVVPFMRDVLQQVDRAIVTPGNAAVCMYPDPASFGCMFQPASVGLQPWGRADAQPILYYGKHPIGGKALPGQKCSYQMTERPSSNEHPCTKPYQFWMKLVAAGSTATHTILDPFAGSGTTGRAAKDLQRKAVLIELEMPNG